jgi:hypothetical protein
MGGKFQHWEWVVGVCIKQVQHHAVVEVLLKGWGYRATHQQQSPNTNSVTLGGLLLLARNPSITLSLASRSPHQQPLIPT